MAAIYFLNDLMTLKIIKMLLAKLVIAPTQKVNVSRCELSLQKSSLKRLSRTDGLDMSVKVQP